MVVLSISAQLSHGGRHAGLKTDHRDPQNGTRMGKFGRDYANRIRRRAPRHSDKWHLDEAVVPINGERQFLWRAVDQDGFVLDVLVQNAAIPRRRSASSANFCQARGLRRVL